MNFFATFNHWFHLAGVVFWIGGIAFQLFVMAPFLASDRPPPDYLLTLSNRFQKCIGPLLMILIVTGGMNVGFRRAGGDLPPGYISALGLKVLLVAVVASLHFFGVIRSQQEDDSCPSPLRFPRQGMIQITFFIGVLIIFIASMLRHWVSPLVP